MKHKALIAGIIALTILISGCVCDYFNDNKKLVEREYSNNASRNIKINIWNPADYNFSISKTNDTNVKVVESFYIKSSFVKNSDLYLDDYVKFIGNETELTINISTGNKVELFGEIDRGSVQIAVYVPANTNYMINKVYIDTSRQ